MQTTPVRNWVTPLRIGSVASRYVTTSPLIRRANLARYAYDSSPAIRAAANAAGTTTVNFVSKLGSSLRKHRINIPPSRVIRSRAQTTRQHGDQPSWSGVPLRNLQLEKLTWPDQGSSVGDRLGPTIRVSGFKLCEQFHNDQAYPIVVHYAVVQLKRASTSSSGSVKTNFFRETHSSNRSSTFVDAVATAPQTYEFKYDCSPINPDNLNILMHEKRVLSAENTDLQWWTDTWKFDKYIKMNGTKFTFDVATTGSEPNNPVYRVIWWQPLRHNDWVSPVPNPLPTISRQSHMTLYYRSSMT